MLAYGPNRGRKVTYSNPHRYTPFQPMNGEEALSALLDRYLRSYGPATPEQFAKWLSTSTAFVRNLFDGLPEVDLEGSRAWLAEGDTAMTDKPATGVRLLPYFDAYGVGSHPRALLFPGRASTRALAGGQAGNYPLLLVDGIVAGVWHQRKSGRKLHVTVEPLSTLSPTRLRALDAEVDRLGHIFDASPVLTIGPVETGPHA